MAVLQRVLWYPALGKGAEVRAMLEERTRVVASRGVRLSLAVQLYAESQAFVTNILHENMAAAEAFQRGLQADGDMQAWLTKVATLSRKPSAVELEEILVMPTAPAGQAAYVQRSYGYPAPGKEPALKSILLEWARARQDEGRTRLRLLQRRYGPTGAVFVAADDYGSLSEIEESWTNPPATNRQVVEAISDMSRAPIRQELYQTLIPLQS